MTDVRALLFTDVVDSTRLAEQMGDAASAVLWVAHDRYARDLLPRWRGREIDRTDGLVLMFDAADDAVGYALAYHAALARLEPPLKARAGVHVGPVTLRENSATDVALGAKPLEVEGIAKSLAARVMATALGGQTLLTSDARAALGATTAQLKSHGHWRFKGIAEPVELYEAGGEHAPFTPPGDGLKAYRVVRQRDLWLPARNVRYSLPAERDSFVNRREAMLELARRFDAGARLVSVLGMGGSGKTRLATRFAWTWLGDFPGGVWFCDLSQARSADGVVQAVAEALDVQLGRQDPVVQLGHAVAGRGPCLVILDNFEQVLRYAEETLGHWLSRAVDACFLVTTREVLGLAGEQAFALAPLAAPDAAELFRRRAESAKHDFAPSAVERGAIDKLVKLLDGLPLAIELAAARVRIMPPHMLLQRMGERFKLLSSAGGRQDRQATLRSTFDWSWDLLPQAEKAALAQLSVFEGGFTLAAAEAVLDLSPHAQAPWPVDAVQWLVDKSFVRQVSEQRFDMLDTVREYVAEHLRTQGRYAGSGAPALAAARARHAAYYAGFSEKQAIADACADLDNLIVACRRAAAVGDAHVAVGALENAWAALRLRGPFRAAIELAGTVCTAPGLAPGEQARAERIAGAALDAAGQTAEARLRFEAALSLARQAGDRHCEALALGNLGNLHRNEGRMDEGRAHLTAALAMACAIKDRSLQCELHNGLGNLNFAMGRLDEAGVEYESALAIARELGDRRWEGGTLGNLGNLHTHQGRMEEGRDDYEAGLAAAREIGNRQWEGNMLCNLGFMHLTQQRLDEARSQFEQALVVAREMGHARLECIVLGNLGIVFGSLGRPGDALVNYEAALAVARRIGERRYEGQFLNYLGLLHARQQRWDEARLSLDAGEALLREVSDKVSLGVLLCSRAEAEHLAGAAAAARVALREARILVAEAGSGPESEFGLSLARVEALLAREPVD
jgi:predicted ATPase/class 3 adenylate cyclase/Tfp pilus assembly protein PilF